VRAPFRYHPVAAGSMDRRSNTLNPVDHPASPSDRRRRGRPVGNFRKPARCRPRCRTPQVCGLAVPEALPTDVPFQVSYLDRKQSRHHVASPISPIVHLFLNILSRVKIMAKSATDRASGIEQRNGSRHWPVPASDHRHTTLFRCDSMRKAQTCRQPV
jgi:hypothetical protein